MDILCLLLIIIILIVILMIIFPNQSEKFISFGKKFINRENFTLNTFLETEKPFESSSDRYTDDGADNISHVSYLKKSDDFLDSIFENVNMNISEPESGIHYEFSESQFNVDYTDTIESFNKITLNRKDRHIFNNEALRVSINKIPVYNEDVKKMSNDFVNKVNHTVNNKITDNFTLDWNVSRAHKQEDGWARQQQELGLPKSIFTDPLGKSEIKLISIDDAELHETNKQRKYIIQMTLQKLSSKDRISIKVNFVMSFIKGKEDYSKNQIEEVFVIGFLISVKGKTKMQDMINMKTFDLSDSELMDPEKAITALNEKKKYIKL